MEGHHQLHNSRVQVWSTGVDPDEHRASKSREKGDAAKREAAVGKMELRSLSHAEKHAATASAHSLPEIPVCPGTQTKSMAKPRASWNCWIHLDWKLIPALAFCARGLVSRVTPPRASWESLQM